MYNIVKSKDEPAFDISDRGYRVKAWYLIEPKGDTLIEVFLNENLLREFLFPAYKIWNIAAHFKDIVDGEIEKNASGYEIAAWNGIGPMPNIKLEE